MADVSYWTLSDQVRGSFSPPIGSPEAVTHRRFHDPQSQHFAQPFIIDVREVPPDVGLIDVPHLARYHFISQGLERHVRVAPRSIPI